MLDSFELPVYLDCNGSTPVEPELLERFQRYLLEPHYLGNCSASHAKKAAEELRLARSWLAAWANGANNNIGGNNNIGDEELGGVRKTPKPGPFQGCQDYQGFQGCNEAGVVFCASATEANNIAILGLRDYGEQSGKKHIIATEMEHSSVRKPCEHLAERYGFTLNLVNGQPNGRIAVGEIVSLLRPDTLLVCCMQVNNETGVVQPVAALAEALLRCGHQAYLHVDAAQGAAHVAADAFPDARISHPRIDMLSVNAHKLYGICGSAALLLKRRRLNNASNAASNAPKHRQKLEPSRRISFPPLAPLLLGGAQQGREISGACGLRSGSVPLALALHLRDALALCEERRNARRTKNREFRRHFLALFEGLRPQLNGSGKYMLPHVCNLQFPGIDAESALLNLRNLVSASRAAACSSGHSAILSPTLSAMGLSADAQNRSLRFSWFHDSPRFWETAQGRQWAEELRRRLQRLQT